MSQSVTVRIGRGSHSGLRITGQIKAWLGDRLVEIEADNGHRYVGTLEPDRPTGGAQ